MAGKCKYCFSKLDEQSSVCKICKIDTAKDKKLLTKEEKKIAYYCRTLSVIGFLAVIGGIIGIFAAAILIPNAIFNKATAGEIVGIILDLILAILFIFFGLSLRKYKKWCYIGGIILYSIALVINITNAVGVLFSLVFLFFIASPTSKKILYAQV